MNTHTPSIIDEDTLPAGCHWSFIAPRGASLQLTDIEGGANVGMLLYNPLSPLERLNIPDTLKCQHTFRLGSGHCLYSDMGRVFCSIGEDHVGWHDGVCGTCHREMVNQRWGEKTYQQARNSMHRNGRDSFLIELAKYGLGKKDLAANMNWFSKVVTDAHGNITLEKNVQAGARLELCFEMDTLVILHTCPHPLDFSPQWPAKPAHYCLQQGDAASLDHSLVMQREENRRGLQNNAIYHHALRATAAQAIAPGHCSHHTCGGLHP